ncbi:cytochrome C oxidase subunit IV family protein [Lihuaxuella thermophila]|uniref:Cytochrome c oxidase subunit 4 n=1 Tax=Lihuaxuella thermophila TaxID=1173111 RepID=A0A1H8IWZ5_9BACL|nr:cytochrome C oxidase subunit IV family protein [Lihuaxuella thermophila]SEN73113.1 cytochrome c oxidase subunit 4 [Lihuaxuella thermophila]
MAGHNQQSTTNQPASRKPEGVMKHLISFAIMIVLTALAFYLVATDVVPEGWVLPLIIIFAAIQVFLQLFTFMHLDQKGSGYYTLFIMAGILIAVVSAVGIILM